VAKGRRVEPTSTPETPASRINGLIIAVAAVALVVGLVVGFGIGWKVEQNRVKDDVNRLREKLADVQSRSLGADRPGTSHSLIVLPDGSELELSSPAGDRS
jgi:hypothetical protein